MSDLGPTSSGGPPGPATAGAGADALSRATRALRDAPETGWGDIADRLRTRLRTLSRPGRPLTVREDEAGVVQVDTRVVVDAVRRAVGALPGTRPLAVVVVVEGTRARSVRVDVAIRFGADAHASADAVRERVREVLRAVLGVAHPVDVTVADVIPDVIPDAP